MKNYVKPQAVAVNSMSEGVYMASGAVSKDCWTVTNYSVQDWNGVAHVYEVKASHSKDVAHISSKVVYTFTFDKTLTDFYSEFPSSFSGNVGIVTRELLADAYYSGDEVTFKIWASTGDEATTKALAAPSVSWECTHSVNVQGGID